METKKIYWLRGAFAGILFPLFCILILLARPGDAIVNGIMVFAKPGDAISDWIAIHLLNNYHYNDGGVFASLIFYLVVGAFLGWLYGKIKSEHE